MHKAYRYSILYFIAFTLLLLASGFLLFEEKIGFAPDAVSAYYLGYETRFIVAKSTESILKILLPHIFAFALLSMVLLHFLKFTSHKKRVLKIVIYTLLITQLFELFTPFLILHISEYFAYLKLLAFFLYFALIVGTLYLLFASIAFRDK